MCVCVSLFMSLLVSLCVCVFGSVCLPLYLHVFVYEYVFVYMSVYMSVLVFFCVIKKTFNDMAANQLSACLPVCITVINTIYGYPALQCSRFL